MSTFWSWYVSVLTIGTLLALLWLVFATRKGEKKGTTDQTMGHAFDGIEEYDNPLPKWWTIMFYATIVWSVFYFAAYPGLGNWKGLLGWTSSNQGIKSLEESRLAVAKAVEEGRNVELDREMVRADEIYGPVFQQFAKRMAKSGVQLKVAELQFQPLKTLARAKVRPVPGQLEFYGSLEEALKGEHSHEQPAT